MATTRPASPSNASTKLTSDSAESARPEGPVTKQSRQAASGVSSKSVNLDVMRKDVARVEVVDTDFVLTTKSGRKILIRDGALNAVTDEEFSVVFADDESVAGKVLFSEAQNTAIDAAPLNWSDAAASETAALVVPAVVSTSGISYTTLGAAALLAAAAGGGGGGSSAPDNSALAKAALAAIGKFADDNEDSMPTASGQYKGTVPTAETYITAGVKGINALNVGVINDSLATKPVTLKTVETLPQLQALVDAYNLVLSLANGEANLDALRPTAEQYTLMGLTGLEPVDTQNTLAVALRAAKTKLLGDVVDRKLFGDVNTIKEIQALLNDVNAVINAIAGGTLTKEQLSSLGITSVTDANLALIINAIDKTNDDGTDIDTYKELQDLVDKINGGSDARMALNIIVQYADNNGNGQSIPPEASHYITAGVITPSNSKVTVQEANAFNDALRTDYVKGGSVDTLDKLQALVDAYRKIFILADGFPNNADDNKDLSQAEYQRIGADISDLNNNASRLRLLNDIVDGQNFEDVNTIDEVNNLIRIANAVQDQATEKASTLSVEDFIKGFKKIGIKGITADNVNVLLNAVAKEGALGTDTVQELQSLLNSSLINGLTFDAISEDSGYSSRDFITNDKTLTLSGTSKAEDGTKLRITLKRTNSDDIVLEGIVKQKEWQVGNGVDLADGEYTVVAQLYDGVQLLSPLKEFAQHVVIDTQSDANLNDKNIAITAIVDDRGDATDFTTTDNTLLYKGTSTAANGTQVAVKIDGVVYWGAEVKDGQWSLDNTGQTLAIGNHKVEAFLADRAGNMAVGSGEKTVIIAEADLKLLSMTTGPIGKSTNLELMFSSEVVAGTGKIVIEDLTSNSFFPAIDPSKNVAQVIIDGRKVIVNPEFDLVSGHQYRATIEFGAFKTIAGVEFEGLSDNAGWTFTAVDPSMTVAFAGAGIDSSDGINKAEFESGNLVVTGEISSVNLNAVSNTRITEITFSSSDGVSTFKLTSTDPLNNNVEGVAWSADGKTWTLANNPSWTSKLALSGAAVGTTYTISAKLEANVSSSPITPEIFSSAPVVVDTRTPLLTSIACDKTVIAKGDVAKFIFTFSEDPKSSFNENSLDVAQVNGQFVGDILSITGSGNTRTVLFQANDNVFYQSASASPALKIKAAGFKDSAGNLNDVQTGLAYPQLTIDTQGPTVTSVVITGVRQNGVETSDGVLVGGDKVRVTLIMSEATKVLGIPIFSIIIGNSTRKASYVQGSGTNTLVFEYKVALGDADTEGGITANANSLSFGTGLISDALNNEAALQSPPVVALANKLVIQGDSAISAFALIQEFAEKNRDPSVLVDGVRVPTVQDYKDALMTGVSDANVDAINNSLATAVIDAAKISSPSKLQDLISAYSKILDWADGKDNNLNESNPDFIQYDHIGVQGVDIRQASLLGDVIDFKKRTDVDTVAEIQNLANAVSAVMNQAKNIAGLTRDQLTIDLEIQGVTADNFAAVKRAINETLDDGSQVSTWEDLQRLVTTAVNNAADSLTALQKFANENNESWPVTSNNGIYKGIVPTWSTYANTGIASEAGVTDTNLTSLINDALATEPITGARITTIADLQKLVTAYASIARLADRSGRTETADLPSADVFNLIGVAGFETPGLKASKTKAQLLSDIIDRKGFDDINTVKEIQALADAVSAVMANAAGTGRVTVEQLKLLGFDVPNNKINAVGDAIASTPNRDGTDVDTFVELSALITDKFDAVDKAIQLIANFADQNTVSKPTPEGNFSYDTKNTPIPTADTYNAVGITGGSGTVTDTEAAAFNDALATFHVKFTSVNSKEKIQALADAYRAILTAADNSASTTLIKPTLEQYGLLGVTGLDVTQEATQERSVEVVAARVSLLGDVIDRKKNDDVDTVLEIQALADIVTRVMNQAKGLDGLTRADLAKLGIQGVTDDNLAAVLQAIRDIAGNVAKVDTYVELQGLVVTPAITRFTTALALIQKYANEKSDPTQLGSEQEQPTVQTYLDLGISAVKTDSLKLSMNSALATQSVKAQQVLTAEAVGDLVNAYLEILAAADGKPNAARIQEKDYTLLGVDNIVGSTTKVSLLSDVIDRKASTAVDTADELQALAGIVNAVMNSAAADPSIRPIPTDGLGKFDQLLALGVTGVTSSNFEKVLLAIQDTLNDGTAVDTVEELQRLVNGVLGTQAIALQIIKTFAEKNTVSKRLTGSGYVADVPVPTAQNYLDAGITGTVTADDASSFNDALATNFVTSDSVSDVSKLQVLVDAYRKFLALADGPDNATSADKLSSTDLTLLGIETSILGESRLKLLSDIVDRQPRTGVDTIAEIDRLARMTNAIQDLAEDKVLSQEQNSILSVENFALLGVKGVHAGNLNAFLKAIKDTDAAGSDSVPELQNLLYGSLSVDFKAISDDTGASNTDFITNDKTLTFSGVSNAADGSKIRINLKRANQADISLEGTISGGLWSITGDQVVGLSDGDYTVVAQLFDGATPIPKQFIFAQHVVVDTSADKRPDGGPDTDLAGKIVNLTAISTNTGSQTDFITSDTTLVFSGTSTAAIGTNIGILIDNQPVRYTTVKSNGTWEFDNTQQTLSTGNHTVEVFLTDAAGNKLSTSVDVETVKIDTSALRLVSQTTGPIASKAQLLLTFSTDVVAVAGKFIRLTDESTPRTIDIAVNDAQVTIDGANVILKLTGTNQLEPSKTYHATIDVDAFRSTAGAKFDGISDPQAWRFQTVDPTTTITLGGTGVDASNGINASEIGALTISGVASSPSWLSVSNAKITKLTFTSNDAVSPHTFSIDANININPDRTWAVAYTPTSTTGFVSGKSYTVKATLTSTINGTDLSVDINNSTPVLVDTAAPGLVITCDKSQLASGQTALVTFTFDEVPVGFTVADISVRTNNTNAIGSLSDFKVTSDPKIYTVVFTPTAGITVQSSFLLSVDQNRYTDSVGNFGKSNAFSPNVLIDTQAPSVTIVSISGVDSSNAPKAANLDVGDKIKITLTMSEVTTVGGGSTPIFSFDLGGVTKIANYASGSGSTTLVFYYTIVSGDNDKDGITANKDSLSLAQLLDASNNVGSQNTPAADPNTIFVDTTASSLNKLVVAAEKNEAKSGGIDFAVYAKAGALRLVSSNVASYNSALDSTTVTGSSVDTTGEVQNIVDAYNTILNLADGNKITAPFATDLQYQLIGVTGLDNPTTVSRSDKANLLSDAIDRKSAADVDTVLEVQALADAVVAVMKAASGVIDGNDVLTRAQLEALGVVRVTDVNMPLVLAAIAGTRSNGVANGGAVNTVAKLQALVDQGTIDAVKAAITLISNFAGDNTISSTTGTGEGFAYAVRTGSTKPDVVHYVTAGVGGVTAANLNAINDALATPDVTGFSTGSASGIQKVVDAYKAVLALADGTFGTGASLQVAQFKDIGVNIGNATNGSSNLVLLNSVLDFLNKDNVDTVQEINTLANTVNAIMDSTGKRQVSSASFLTVENFAKLSIGSVNETNIAGILESIAAQPNGTKIDTRGTLQSLVNFYVAAAPSVILAADTGVNTQDGRTKDASLNIGNPSVSGATSYVSIDGGKTYVTANDYNTNNTSTRIRPDKSGDYTVLVRQVNAEGFLGQTRSMNFTLDVTAPEVIKVTPTDSTDVVSYGATDFGKAKLIAPNIQQANDGDVAIITLSLTGVDANLDKFTYRSSGTTQQTVSLLVDIQPTVVTIGDVQGVSFKFNAATQTFEFFSTSSSRVFSNAQVQAIESALGFLTASQANSTRTFKFSHTDVAGNSNATTGAATVTLKIDNEPPSTVLFSGTNSQAEFGFYNQAANINSSAVAIAANIKTSTDTDIAKIQLTIGGAGLNFTHDRILFGGPNNVLKTLRLDQDDSDNGWAIGGVIGVDWKYNAAAKTLTFSLSNKAAFKNFEVAALEASLLFQIRDTQANTEGERKFTFDHIDLAGWSTQTSNRGATKIITADYKPPSDIDLDGSTGAVEKTTLQHYGKSYIASNASLLVAPQIGVSADGNDISSFRVVIGGAIAGEDQFSFGSTVVDLSGILKTDDISGTGVKVGDVDRVAWVYTASSRTFTFTRSIENGFTVAQVQAIEKLFTFKTTGNTQGDRTFTFTHYDFAGNDSTTAIATIKVDTREPGAVDLDGTNGVVDATSLQYFNQTVLSSPTQAIFIASNIAQPAENDIASISVAIGGAKLDVNNDQVVINNLTIALNVDKPPTNESIAGVSGVTWSYSGKTLTFTKTNKTSFSAADVQKIESALTFKTNGSSQGERTFTFTHTDLALNASTSATATITVDTFVPEAVDLDDSTGGIQNTIERLVMNIANLAGVRVAEKMNKASSDEGVVSIQVSAKTSVVISSDDKLVFGSKSVAIGGPSTDPNNAPINIGSVRGINWAFRASDKTLIFTKADTNNRAFSAAEVQIIERELIFQTSANANAGDRKFEFTHTDAAGNTSAPATVTFATDVKASIVSLSASSANFTVIDTTPTIATPLTALGANVSEEDRVSKFQIRVKGLRAGSAERIVSGTTEIDATGGVRSGTVAVAGINWDWSYNLLLASFAFTTPGPDGRGATPGQADAFLRSLSYRATTETPGDDVRQFFVSATDAVGNTSAEAVSSVVLTSTAPAKHPTNSAVVLDGNDTDRYIGDAFVLTFNEPVRVSLVSDTLAWTVIGGNLGTGARVRAVDSVTVNGIDYATNFFVTTGDGANIISGQAKTATFTTGSSSYDTKPAIVMPAFTLTSSAITMEAWIFPTTPSGSFQRIFDFGTTTAIQNSGISSGTSIWLGFNAGSSKLAFEYLDTPSGSQRTSVGVAVSPNTITANTWRHVAVTFSGTTATLYENGKAVSALAANGDAVNFTKPLAASVTFNHNFIGKSNWVQDASFLGSIFDARVYTRARTAAEIFNDYKGWIDKSDPEMLFQYDLNGDTKNGVDPNTPLKDATLGPGVTSRDATTTGTGLNFATGAGTTITVSSANVVDAAGRPATGNQVFQLYKSGQTVGGLGSDTVTGTSGNDFISGQGGNDTLTGGTGSDTFAWFLGETGNDRVTDFKVSDGDMVDLSGLLSALPGGLVLGTNNVATWGNYLRLSKSGNDMVLSIDLTGGSFATTTTKTITFTNGALNGLDDNLVDLVTRKTINLTAQTSTPLIFDLNGDGVHTLSVTNGVAFDPTGQGGGKVKTGWADGKDGLLVLDLNGDGKINNGTELFGSGTKLANGGNATDGFEALRQYDSNQDHVMDAKDAVFNNLQLWVDANQDGVTDSGELHSLSFFGVQSISLTAESSSTLDNGNLLGLVSKWTGTDGQAHQLADVWFNTTYLTPLETMVIDGQKVDLTAPGKTSYDVRLNDVLSTASKTMVITADANDAVQIDYAGWTKTGSTASINNHVYNHWENGNAHLMIDQLARVNAVL